MPSPYISNTEEDRRAMLAAIGVVDVVELFTDIPDGFRNPTLDLPPSLSELEVKRELGRLAARNTSLEDIPSFMGAGSYRHFIPAVVGHCIARNELCTSYTPYQPEVSQGTLQATYEYQSLICLLTGMDVSNGGMYDGATALAEAALMACRVTGRHRVAVLDTVNPTYRQVLATYARGQGIPIDTLAGIPDSLGEDVACLLVQQPNFFGCLEDVARAERAAHAIGGLLVVSVDPISLGLLRPPGDYGADIVVGEGQPLGVPLNFGGPYLGIFACREQYLRQIPGRLVGRTRDARGEVGYVMTLQTREQHIRRERATSNICTSETLVAIAAAVYLAAMGKQGLRQVAEHCYHKAHYAAAQIARLPGFSLAYDRPFFKEFVVRCPVSPAEVNRRLLERGIIGGLDVSSLVENGMLLCVTEMNTREEIDRLVSELHGIGGERR